MTTTKQGYLRKDTALFPTPQITNAQLLQARHYPGGGVRNGTLYVWGGYQYPPSTWLSETETIPTDLSALAVASISLPGPSGGAATGMYGDYGHLFAGTASGNGYGGATSYRFQFSTQTWITHPHQCPYSAGGPSYAQVGNMLYVWGGATGAGQTTNVHFAYDMEAGTWTQKQSYPTNITHCRGFTGPDSNYIYGCGGRFNDTTYVNNIYRYSISANSWSLYATMPRARGYAGCFIYNNKIYILGGSKSDGGTPETVVDIYDMGTNTWSVSAKAMTNARGYAGAAQFDYSVLFWGGFISSSFNTIDYQDLREY